jgi:Cu+-exporting ATPase
VALEKAGTVTAVMFDKTGTLTVGRPEVVKIWESSGVQNPKSEGRGSNAESVTVKLAAGLAAHSSHPISQTVAKLSSEVVEVADWKEVHGAGVQGNVRAPLGGMSGAESGLARLGSLRWLQESEVDLSPGQAFIQEWSTQGATVIGLAFGKTLLGLFAVKDTLKTGAREVVAELGRQGLVTYLVTGDNPVTARSIAAQAGIEPERVFSEVRPEEKAGLVKKLQQEGKRVAFVGDGINDAPALEQADLGIAVSRASDIAREAADIILLKSEIEAVPESLGLARATLRTIKQNLFWAFFYNAVGIPLAALGFMSPILCAAAMGLSDVVVIGNALRLRRWRG